MSKLVSYAQFDLGYPPWALDFDPYNRGYLLVGGGGGEGQKEVPNRLTLLDVSSRHSVFRAAELATNIEEDCPVSLGVLSTKDGLYAYTGLNSGAADRRKGINNHFRTFKVDFPGKAKSKAGKSTQGNITPVSKISLFSPSFCESDGQGAYQRLLRLSPAKGQASASKRIGAVASSLSKDSEIVIFNATTASPSNSDVIQRIRPSQNAEANDIDIIEPAENDFKLAYCTQTEVYVSQISYDFSKRKPKNPPEEPKSVFSISDMFQQPGRPRLRSLRFLTPNHILLLTNRGSQSELQILRIYAEGLDGDIDLRKQLPKRMAAAVSLDVCILNADVVTGARQIIVAVAAQSQDVALYTLDYSGPSKDSISTFSLYSDLRGVHNMAMKKVVLEPFKPPGLPGADSSPKKKKQGIVSTSGPLSVRLASISLSNMVVIETLPLQPLHPRKPGSRHVLSKGNDLSRSIGMYGNLTVLGFVLVISLLLLQSFLNARAAGENPSLQLLPQSLQNYLTFFGQRASDVASSSVERVEEVADPYVHSQVASRLRDFLHLRHHNTNPPDAKHQAIIVRAPEDGSGELSTEVHSDTAELLRKHAQARKWEELSKNQQQRWKQRLIEAGEWVESQGETVLKGIFFSELAGAVGQAAAEAFAGG